MSARSKQACASLMPITLQNVMAPKVDTSVAECSWLEWARRCSINAAAHMRVSFSTDLSERVVVCKDNTSVAECSLSEWARRCAISSPEALNSSTQNAMMHTQDLVLSETVRSETLPLSFENVVTSEMAASVAEVPK